MDSKKIQRLNQFINFLSDDGVTRQEFLASFSKVLSQVSIIESKLIQKINKAEDDLKTAHQSLKTATTDDLEAIVDKYTKQIDKALKEQQIGMNFIYDKLRRIKEGEDGKDGLDGRDGKDAEPINTEKMIKDILGKIEVPEIDESKIKEIKKEIDELKKRPSKGGGGFSRIHLKQALAVTGTGTSHIYVSATQPTAASSYYGLKEGDLWVDIS